MGGEPHLAKNVVVHPTVTAEQHDVAANKNIY